MNYFGHTSGTCHTLMAGIVPPSIWPPHFEKPVEAHRTHMIAVSPLAFVGGR